MSEYWVSDKRADMDDLMIHNFLKRSYWANTRSFETQQRAMDHSLNFGILNGDNEQLGFARIVTDYATFAYLADVFILEEHRNKGLGKLLIERILKHPHIESLKKIMLSTKDAHELYRPFGFESLENPQSIMQIIK